VTVASISGRVDSVTALTLDTELEKMARENNRLVLDLKDTAYMSSAGMRAVLKTLQNAKKSGGAVKLARVPDLVGEVLQTVGMLEMLQSYPSVDEAVASF